MERPITTTFLLISCSSMLVLTLARNWSDYDSTAYTHCGSNPEALLYKGGIIINPDFNDGLSGWSPFGSCKLEVRSQNCTDDNDDDDDDDDDDCGGGDEDDAHQFLVATNRSASFNGPSQMLQNLTSGTKYSISAWLQTNGPPGTSTTVKATVVTDNGRAYVCAGTVSAQSGCWSFLKGGFALDYTSTTARLYFETLSFTSGLEIWLDRVSVQPFPDEEWRAHQNKRREALRRRTVKLHVVDSGRKRIHDAKIEVVGAKLGFPFGSAIGPNILTDKRYQDWFLERFNTGVFENEMKWYATEQARGRVDYNLTDRMMAFCEARGLAVRGHNVVWEDPKFQQGWVKRLGAGELREAVMGRVRSVVGRYAGRVVGWDVSNEQLHFSFYEDAIGDANATALIFLAAQALDPAAPLFVNDYNVLEDCSDARASPDAFAAALRRLQAAGVAHPAIGLEAHFSLPNLPFIRSSLDKLATLRLPIWLTELDINVAALGGNITRAAVYLEEVLREAFSHPAVEGIVLWTGWHPNGCYRMCLTDANMTNLATGNVVDALLHEWQQIDTMHNTSIPHPLQHNESNYQKLASNGGSMRWRGPVGEHKVVVQWRNSNFTTSLQVVPGRGPQHFVLQLPISSNLTNLSGHGSRTINFKKYLLTNQPPTIQEYLPPTIQEYLPPPISLK